MLTQFPQFQYCYTQAEFSPEHLHSVKIRSNKASFLKTEIDCIHIISFAEGKNAEGINPPELEEATGQDWVS